LRPEPYWHLTPARGSFLLNNAHVGDGICWSVTAFRRKPALGQAIESLGLSLSELLTFRRCRTRRRLARLHALLHAITQVRIVCQENAWERTRQLVDKNFPSRQHALFLFDDEGMADRARQTWFPNENRLLVETRIVVGARVHRADSLWLNCHPLQWGKNAERYWRGEMTADPLPEILVDGAVYFPGWKDLGVSRTQTRT